MIRIANMQDIQTVPELARMLWPDNSTEEMCGEMEASGRQTGSYALRRSCSRKQKAYEGKRGR